MQEDIQFQNDYTPEYSGSEAPKMIQWIMKLSGGKIQDEKQANFVLLGFVVVIIIVTIFIFISSMSSPSTNDIDDIMAIPEDMNF